MKFSRFLVAVLAASLLLTAAAVPASAADPTAKAAVSKKKLNRDLRKVRVRTTTAERRIRAINTTIAALQALANGNKTGLDFLNSAAPQLVNGLTQLRDGSLQLKAGLEQAGAGLVALRDATTAGFNTVRTSLTSTEYGIAQAIVIEDPTGTPAPNPQEGSFVQTPDVPDAVQQAQVTQQFVAQQAGVLAIAYGVRSGESDGTGAELPAAHCRVTVTDSSGAVGSTGPNAAFGGLPYQAVNDKSALTSTDAANAAFPFGLKTSGADADKTTTLTTSVPVSAGEVYTLGLACVDVSPDANNPSA